MNHDTLNLAVKFIIRARKITGPVEAQRLVADLTYRDEVFNKVIAEGDVKLTEMAYELRDQIDKNESVASSSTLRTCLSILLNIKTVLPFNLRFRQT